jgi:short-subunit dehydrogenase
MATARKSVFITGASSGIGLALAKEYAARGFDLALAARRLDVIEALQQDIAASHPDCNVFVTALDVTRYEEVFAALGKAAQQLGKLDIIIANAGIGSSGRVGHGYFDDHRLIIETNVIGAMATCDAAIKLFKRQSHGQLVIMSSVAAFRGLPANSAYSASKAAVATYAQSIRAEIYGSNLTVTTIYPGYIDTPINQGAASRPFLITAKKGAAIIANKIERKVQTAIVPAFPWVIVAALASKIPTRFLARSR